MIKNTPNFYPEIKALTGLRGIAALWVVTYHVLTMNLGHDHTVAKNLMGHGYLAVDLFFVLSGFVMALSYKRFFINGWTLREYSIFLLRRLARIYPLYIATTCFITVFILLGLSKPVSLDNFSHTFFLNLTLIQAWGFAESINGYAWSISTEFAAYLIFPLLTALLLTGNKFTAYIATALCCASLYFLQFAPSPGNIDYRQGPLDIPWAFSILPLVRCISEFCLGLMSYRLFQVNTVQRLASHSSAAIILSGILLFLLSLPDTDIAVVILLPALIITLAQGSGIIQRVLGGKIFFFLGEISYSIYLLHSQFLRIRTYGTRALTPYLGEALADVASIGILFSALIACSWIAYSLIEKPCRYWIRKIENLRVFAPKNDVVISMPQPLNGYDISAQEARRKAV